MKDDFCKGPGGLSDLDFIDIDSDHTNPQMCCLYSSDIYTNLRAAEVCHVDFIFQLSAAFFLYFVGILSNRSFFY